MTTVVDNAEKVGGFTGGETNVPANAKFTDVYTHPTNHPASIITRNNYKKICN